MPNADIIKNLAKYGLENDQEKLLATLQQLIDHSRKTKKLNFAIQLQSLLKDAISQNRISGLTKAGSAEYYHKIDEKEINDFILEKVTSDYKFENLICDEKVIKDLRFFIEEHRSAHILNHYGLPIANKLLFHGPSGCGKTLASYVMAGELQKLIYVINLGAIVSSRLGETSKNIAKVFRRAASENCVIFLDEFDSLGKVRDYSQDHGEMKRVVNTILQLFDFMPQECILIAATNQKDMIDDALLRRFDVNVEFVSPDILQIESLIKLTLKNGRFKFDSPDKLPALIKKCKGLSYFSIQKTLVSAIKRSLFESEQKHRIGPGKISTSAWVELITEEKKALAPNKKTRK